MVFGTVNSFAELLTISTPPTTITIILIYIFMPSFKNNLFMLILFLPLFEL